ncbi:MAG TPA: bifunctional phosphoribosyl-AMP cyclohydrolase/phosphoribosyl-ATP diphosphatase HisIE [Polyangiaceae bacterium]|nr:bifunctional phosphoribosyl-AMP cyclohydrolase/phosphoribosyl-ATP diphosphatase HisIE [Polyangiaceae bacterium]
MKPAFDSKTGLIPAIAQDRLTGEIRMVAWMNQEALTRTLETGKATFFSRSRQALWEKGESSGHSLRVQRVAADCDADVLLLLVDPDGPSCHTGRPNCFFHEVRSAEELVEKPAEATPFLPELEALIRARSQSTAEKSYTRSLLDGGPAKIGAKLREEADELARAIADESEDRVASEAADLMFHALVGLRARDVPLRAVLDKLASRMGQSGHAEKASRGR